MGKRRYGRIAFEASNEEKVLFPDAGLTKGGLIAHYERVAERLLPHLSDRPLVLHRFPDGIRRGGFWQKSVASHAPPWLSRATVELVKGGRQELHVCDSRAALAWLADQAAVELHPWLSRVDRLQRPDLLVVDLDPAGQDFEAARRGALALRRLLDELGLPAYAKLTGSRGVHVVTPLDRSASFDEVRAFARALVELLAARAPGELTTAPRKRARRGRLYLDVARNAYGQTAVAPYSVRALPGAPVALPVTWAELERGRLGPRDTTVANLARRLGRRRDPWAGMRRRGHSLRGPARRLARLREREGLA